MVGNLERLRGVDFGGSNLLAESVELMPFQGERSKVYRANLGNGEKVIIKLVEPTSAGEMNEIEENLMAYGLIGASYLPKIWWCSEDRDVLVMEDAGDTLKDVVWRAWLARDMKEVDSICDGLIHGLKNMIGDTSKESVVEKDAYLGVLKKVIEGFVNEHNLGIDCERLDKMWVEASCLGGSKVAFATTDGTQGNFLFSKSEIGYKMKIIDMKRPRVVSGNLSVLGIPEIDWGMYLVTAQLNSPLGKMVPNLDTRLLDVFTEFRGDTAAVKRLFDIGKVCGNILIATFPNTLSKVRTYLESVGEGWTPEWEKTVLSEKQSHLEAASLLLVKMYR